MLPLPPDELERLKALHDLAILDTAPEGTFDSVVRLAQRMFGAPIALITFVDADRQWFKARWGTELKELPREAAFCAHAILTDDVFVVEDTKTDSRFETNRLVAKEPRVRFYAGAPIIMDSGVRVGTVCILDTVPRSLTADEQASLRDLADLVAAYLRQHRAEAQAVQETKARQEQETALRERNDMLRLAEQMAQVGRTRVDLLTGELTWSDEVYRTYGIDPSGGPLTLEDAYRAHHPDDVEELKRLVRNAREHGTPYERRSRIVRPDGEVRHIVAQVVCERGDNGKPVALVGVIRDVTEVYQTEDALRLSRDLLEITLENMDQGLIMVDRNGIVQVCNRRAADLLGLPMELTTSKPHFLDIARHQIASGEFDGGGLEHWLQANLVEPLSGPRTFERERPNGTVLEIRTKRLPDGGAVRTYTDVTERRQREIALRVAEAEYRTLYENAVVGIFRTSPDGTQARANPALVRLNGYESEQELLDGMKDIASEWYVDAGRRDEFIRLMEEHGRVTDFVSEVYRHKTRERIWVSETAWTVPTRDGKSVWYEGTIIEATDRMQGELALAEAKRVAEAAQAVAEQASQAKTEFLASMSHEIRTPLNGIIGYTDLLLDDTTLSAEQQRQVLGIQSAGSALLTVVNDILDFSRIEAGQALLEPRPFRLATLLDSAVSVVQALALKKGIGLRVELAPGLAERLLGDEDRLRQVLLNLLNNAVKFTPSGSVTLDVSPGEGRHDAQRLRFAVLDTGIGIPAERRDRLFQRFSQLDGSIRREFGGSGLGLAISKRLVELMGGTIGVESEPGRGSTFWFEVDLPVAVERAQTSTGSPTAASRGPALRILLAEDNEINQEIAKAVLSGAGHSVDVVPDGAEAIMAVQAREYDLVLMDISMPVVDGLSATQHIRSLPHPASQLPIIAMTANVLPQQVAEFRAAGMDDHIGKPFKKEELYAVVQRWARGRERVARASDEAA